MRETFIAGAPHSFTELQTGEKVFEMSEKIDTNFSAAPEKVPKRQRNRARSFAQAERNRGAMVDTNTVLYCFSFGTG